MLMNKGKGLNQFPTYAKGATKVNLLQRCYKRICSTSESEAWREMQQQPKEQNYSPMQRKGGGKLGEEEVEMIGSSQPDLLYTENNTSAYVLKKSTLSFHFCSCHLICLQTFLHSNHFIHLATYSACWGVYLIYSITEEKKGVLRHAVIGKPLFKGGLQTIPDCNELHDCAKENCFYEYPVDF